ncbi:scyllo-inositol 2-dehydrogenase (NAD(+)) [Fusarium oxysporum f. sp. albedinis]|nr:scyllo-inositol 2-dehydrogenase (NAD(+)) [Fusarium oxysporum f. sp. albedinis]
MMQRATTATRKVAHGVMIVRLEMLSQSIPRQMAGSATTDTSFSLTTEMWHFKKGINLIPSNSDDPRWDQTGRAEVGRQSAEDKVLCQPLTSPASLHLRSRRRTRLCGAVASEMIREEGNRSREDRCPIDLSTKHIRGLSM